jgi:hypothetical protein
MIRILQLSDLDAILKFERTFLETVEPDTMEREMREWHAPWRREALEHYLPLGWSFADFEGEHLKGYFLAQPQLFIRDMTQTLWIEHFHALDLQVQAALFDVAYRTCREKHFQKLVLREQESHTLRQSDLRLEPVGDKLLEVKTAKF